MAPRTEAFFTWLKAKWKDDDGALLPEEFARSLAAYYWSGAAPVPHPVRDVSVLGAFILTSEKWVQGTIINLMLQRGSQVAGSDAALSLRSRVTAQAPDGVRVKFLYLNRREREAARKFFRKVRIEAVP